MKIDIRGFEETDVYQWVKTLSRTHYLVIDGIMLPNGYVDFGYYDIDFLSSDIEIDQLDELINEYYSSCSDFFLAATDDNRQQHYQFIAEMIAEQDWHIDPLKTCVLSAKELENVEGDQLLEIIKKKMKE